MADQVDIEVPSSLDGARLDKALAELLHLSRAGASRLFEEGVDLEGTPARASDRVRAGEVISCRPSQGAPRLAAEDIEFGVLHEDDDVIVVDKPAGLVVHPGSGQGKGTLAAGLLFRFPEIEGVGAPERWGLVHRLDKDTSGALLVARNAAAFDSLTADLRQRRVNRVYEALVEGRLGAPTGTVEAPIGRDPSQPTRRAVIHGGKEARTHYEVLRYYQGSDASLLEVTLETGRTHQIRVHMAAIGHPVAGDGTYGATRKDLAAPRTFLHASRLQFDHPTTGERLTIESKLPDDLAAVLRDLT